MKRNSLCFVLLIVLAACPLASQPTRADGADEGAVIEDRTASPEQLEALLIEIEKKLGSIRSLSADFVQEKHLAIFTEPVRAEGAMYFRAPDSVRFEITQPFRSVLIARGKAVASYEHVGGKWKKLRVAVPDGILMVTRQIASWLQGRLHRQEGSYDISARIGERTVVLLTPKHEKLKKYVSVIELVLPEERDRITSIVIREPGGDYTRMKFLNEARNVDVEPAVFDTTRAEPPLAPRRPKKPAAEKAAAQEPTE